MPAVWNRDSTITAFITQDGPEGLNTADGNAKALSQAAGGGLCLFLDREDTTFSYAVGGVVVSAAQRLPYEYDFALQGGAISNIELYGPEMPAGWVTLNGFVQVLTACTSAGSATVSLGTKTGAATNLLAATAVASLTANAGFITVPDYATIADRVREATAVKPVAGIAVAALTAGRIKAILDGCIMV